MEKERYNHLNKYYKELFGERTLKICIDGGFTCPNRDGTVGVGGCIFCSSQGSGELIANKFNNLNSIECCVNSIKNQVESYFKSYRATRANKFIVYFQNFTNTYDSISNLKRKYDAALIDDRIIGLSIATRPDCINEEIVKLIKSYANKYYVSVELGLQTSNDNTGLILNRGYNSSDFTNAVELLNKYSIPVVTHIMVGLPNENKKIYVNYSSYNFTVFEDVSNTVKFLNTHNIHGLKIHSTYIVKNTVLEKMYLEHKYAPLKFEDYMDNLIYIIAHINPNIIIHRISGDSPKDILVAPEWNLHKKWVINWLEKKLAENNLYQGMFFDNKSGSLRIY